MRRLAFWLVCNVPLGPLAPHVLAYALRTPARKVEE